MPVTISFQPSPQITPSEVAIFRIYRKADLVDPGKSFEVATWSLYATVNDPSLRQYVDRTGEAAFWYRVETCRADGTHAPWGPLIPGHGNSSFANLRAGYGYLSSFAPNALDVVFIYDEVHKATEFVVEHLLRPKFSLETILGFYKTPLPAIRQITEVIAAESIIGQLRPSDEDALKFLQSQRDRLAKEFSIKQSFQTNDMLVHTADRETNADQILDWGR
jgi:hypothetical protein